MTSLPKIFLTGFMGSGKTTVGRLLARRLGVPFLDLDVEIRRKTGLSIPRIFAVHGEQGFRRMETSALRDVCGREGPFVVATGGGIVTRRENLRLMRRHGLIVHLRVSAATALKRIGDGHSRPLLAGLTPRQRLQTVRHLLAQRASAYAQHDIAVTTDRLPPTHIADRLAKKIRAFSSRQPYIIVRTRRQGGPL